jgi:hypothetical protein
MFALRTIIAAALAGAMLTTTLAAPTSNQLIPSNITEDNIALNTTLSRRWNINALGEYIPESVYCNFDQVADIIEAPTCLISEIRKGIDYVQFDTESKYCVVEPHSEARVSCANDAGIYLINHSDETQVVECWYVGVVADYMLDWCLAHPPPKDYRWWKGTGLGTVSRNWRPNLDVGIMSPWPERC